MQVNNVIAATSNNAKAAASGELNGDAFLTLLIAQLRSQNPFEPMDPTEFVNQLVQFNQLEQTIRIRQVLERNTAGVEPSA